MSQEGPLGKRLGVVVAGSLSRGLEVRLDGGLPVEEVAVGRYVTVEGERRRFFGMVTDIGLEAVDPGFLAFPPDTDPFIAQVLTGTATYGSLTVLPLLALSGEAATLLEGPQPAKTIPGHFAVVREASPRDVELVFGSEDERRFVIGNPLDMEAKVCLDAVELVKRSNGVFGKTGTGKSFLTRLLLIDIIQKDAAACLVFDWHSEYGWAGRSEAHGTVKGLRQLFPPKVAVFTLDAENARRRQVQFDIVVQIGYQEVEPEDIELLAETLNLTELALGAVHRLRRRFGPAWLREFLSLSPEGVKELAEGGEHEGTLNALRRRLEALRRLPFLTPEAPEEDSVKRLLHYLEQGMSVVLEFGRYTSELAYILVANILTRRLHQQYRERVERAMGEGTGEPRPLMIVIEEAHKFLNPRLADQTIFGTIAREMRKFNVTLLVVDQRPSGIDEEVTSQLGTKFVFPLDNERDIDSALAGVAGKGELKAVLSHLGNQRQVLIQGHAVPMPVVVEVREFGSAESYRRFGQIEPAERRRRAEQDIKELWE